MSKTLVPTIRVAVSGSKGNVAELETAGVTLNKVVQQIFANGTGDNQVDLLYSKTLTLTTTAAQALDLTGSATFLDAVFGNEIDMAKVRAILIYNKGAGGKVVRVGGVANGVPVMGSSTPAAEFPFLILPVGAFVLLCAPLTGWVVTGGTGDLLSFVNATSGTSVVDVMIFGTST